MNVSEKANLLMELIRNSDRDLPHKSLEPADLRAKLERVSMGAFAETESYRVLGFVMGVCLSFGWVTAEDLKEITDGTFRRKAKPQSTSNVSARKPMVTEDGTTIFPNPPADSD